MGKFAAITRVLNEADIIESFIRHTAAFVSHHVVMDNGSADGTIEILEALVKEGLPISVYQSRAVTFNESDALTQLYVQACKDVSPDWVLCLDADEFIDDRHTMTGLRSLLEGYAIRRDGPECLKVPMVNYIATSQDEVKEPIVPLRIRRRRPPSDAYKLFIRGGLPQGQITIQHGSHWAAMSDRPLRDVVENRIWLAHYSERSPYQYILKFVRGWSKVLATGQIELDKKTAYHYKAPYEFLRDTPTALLRNKHFMGFKDEAADLVDDPIAYRGGPLKYTPSLDEGMRAVRGLMGVLDDLSKRHGKLMDEFPMVHDAVRDWEQTVTKLL